MKRHILTVLTACLICACSPPKTEPGQVIARINGDEISVHQLNFAIEKNRTATPSDATRDAMLERLLDRQVAMQQAIAAGLDRRAEIMMRLEEARRDILATAYAESVASSSSTQISSEAIARYYSDHPALFKQRRVYRVREVTLGPDMPALEETRGRLARKEDLATVISWLQQQPGRFSDQSVLRPAEQFPVEIADRMIEVQPGQTISFVSPQGLVIYQLQSSEPAALSWEDAEPLIRTFLKKQQASEIWRNELKRLRAKSETRHTPGVSTL